VAIVFPVSIPVVVHYSHICTCIPKPTLPSSKFNTGAFLVTASDDMTVNLKRKWFEAVIRQDMAYFDLQDVSGTTAIMSTNGAKYKKGISKKLGSGVQLTCTVLVRRQSMYSGSKTSIG